MDEYTSEDVIPVQLASVHWTPAPNSAVLVHAGNSTCRMHLARARFSQFSCQIEPLRQCTVPDKTRHAFVYVSGYHLQYLTGRPFNFLEQSVNPGTTLCVFIVCSCLFPLFSTFSTSFFAFSFFVCSLVHLFACSHVHFFTCPLVDMCQHLRRNRCVLSACVLHCTSIAIH